MKVSKTEVVKYHLELDEFELETIFHLIGTSIGGLKTDRREAIIDLYSNIEKCGLNTHSSLAKKDKWIVRPAEIKHGINY